MSTDSLIHKPLSDIAHVLGDDYLSSAQKLIAIGSILSQYAQSIGDASTRKDEDCGSKKTGNDGADKLSFAGATSPANTSEISVVDEDALAKSYDVLAEVVAYGQHRASIRAYENARKPVSVSLEACTDAVYGAALNRATFSDGKVNDTREFSKTLAKAVLDEAGVTYVN